MQDININNDTLFLRIMIMRLCLSAIWMDLSASEKDFAGLRTHGIEPSFLQWKSVAALVYDQLCKDKDKNINNG